MTVKLTLKLADIPLVVFETVTIAVYVPAARLLFGTTVKLLLPPTAILEILAGERVKLAAFVPDKATVNVPVA